MQTDQLIAQLAQEMPTVRPAASAMVLGRRWLLALALYGVVITAMSSLRSDIYFAMQHPLFAAEIFLLVGLIISSVLSAALLSFPDLYQKRWLARLPIVFFAAFVLVMVVALAGDPHMAEGPHDGLPCLSCISLYAVLPGVLLLRAMTRLASTHGAWAGLSALLAAFSAGALLLRLHEPTDSITHVVVWHYLPMLAVAFLGLMIGRRVFKW